MSPRIPVRILGPGELHRAGGHTSQDPTWATVNNGLMTSKNGISNGEDHGKGHGNWDYVGLKLEHI